LEQKSGSIFQFDTQRPDDDFAGTPVEFYISPVSDEWQYSGGEGGFGLISEDPVAPASVQLRYTRPMWLPVDGDIVVWEGSIRE
jgi:hypothetical protein